MVGNVTPDCKEMWNLTMVGNVTTPPIFDAKIELFRIKWDIFDDFQDTVIILAAKK